MAITEIHSISQTPDKAIRYVMADKVETVLREDISDRILYSKDEKTGDVTYYTLSCTQWCTRVNEPERDFQRLIHYFGQRELQLGCARSKDGEAIVAWHLTQSFDSQIDPRIANEIGRKLAEEIFPGHPAVISTHTNTDKTHNHIVACAWNRDGVKYNSCHETYQAIRRKSDALCAEYGLSVLEQTREQKLTRWKDSKGRVRYFEPTARNQKLKPYVVLEYLMKYSDENNTKSAYDIIGYLEGCGISAERRSIYRDIEDINRIMLMLQEDIDLDEVDMMFEEAEESGDEEEVNDLKTILYDKNKKGFYVRQRKFEVADMRLLAECVYAAKFIAEGQAKRLVNVICDFVSEEQASKIKHNAFLVDRVKTDNRGVMNNIATINDAMSRHLDGEIHTPEKITFKYLKYSVNDMSTQVERRKGARYKISPFQLLINDGNYYLLAFDDYSKEMRTYRVDRMKDIRFTGEPRDGDDVFKKIDLRTYTKRVFSMYGGEQRLVELHFVHPLLDAVVDRFGTKDVQYAKVDDTYFGVTAKVEISEQFFGWILGFGSKAKLVYPEDVMTEFSGYLDRIREMY